MPPRSARPMSGVASYRPPSSCAACSLASPTTPGRWSAPGPSPGGSRCRRRRRSDGWSISGEPGPTRHASRDRSGKWTPQTSCAALPDMPIPGLAADRRRGLPADDLRHGEAVKRPDRRSIAAAACAFVSDLRSEYCRTSTSDNAMTTLIGRGLGRFGAVLHCPVWASPSGTVSGRSQADANWNGHAPPLCGATGRQRRYRGLTACHRCGSPVSNTVRLGPIRRSCRRPINSYVGRPARRQRDRGQVGPVGSWVTEDRIVPFKIQSIEWLRRMEADGLRARGRSELRRLNKLARAARASAWRYRLHRALEPRHSADL